MVYWVSRQQGRAHYNLRDHYRISDTDLERGPFWIARGPDDALWFTEFNANKIGRITTAGIITEYVVPSPNQYFYGITAGPDGALWFTEFFANKIGRISTAGAITEYPLPPTGGSGPAAITAGPGNTLWFTEPADPGKVGSITTSGIIKVYSLPTQNSLPSYITKGPDGAVWFTESVASKIGRITPAGRITEYPLAQSGSNLVGITAASGALWFANFDGPAVGRITVSGLITEYGVPTAGSAPTFIAPGPDGALWFTEWFGNKIGRAPACALGLSASFARHTLTTNFDLGINRSAFVESVGRDDFELRAAGSRGRASGGFFP
jgi:virginiamycin B lyase